MSDDPAKTKTYVERLDPEGEVGKQALLLGALAGSSLGRVFLRFAGVDPKELAEAKATHERLTREPDRIAAALSEHGWIVHGLAPIEAYGMAATLVMEGKLEEAEQLLVGAYAENDHALIRFYHRVISLYGGDEQRRAIGHERARLLREAYELHTEGHYAGAISIILAQIDGIFLDMTGKTFYETRNPALVDALTLAGHPLSVKTLSRLMSEHQAKTVVSGKLTRHGVLHGRVLAYDSVVNATKVWAALIAVIEIVGPRAKKLSVEAAAANERRYAGSKALDEYGRRLDRRGFDEARDRLHTVHQYEHGYYTRHGRFACDLVTLDPGGKLPAGTIELNASPDGSSYWAWIETATGVVFGFSQKDGDFNNYWVYVEESRPSGGVGEDEHWRHITDPDLSPDW